MIIDKVEFPRKDKMQLNNKSKPNSDIVILKLELES